MPRPKSKTRHQKHVYSSRKVNLKQQSRAALQRQPRVKTRAEAWRQTKAAPLKVEGTLEDEVSKTSPDLSQTGKLTSEAAGSSNSKTAALNPPPPNLRTYKTKSAKVKTCKTEPANMKTCKTGPANMNTTEPADLRTLNLNDGETMNIKLEVVDDEGEDPLEDVKPLLVCRGCLAADLRLRFLDPALTIFYRQLIGTPVSHDDIYPKFLCTNCCTLLLKFAEFRTYCRSAQDRFQTLHATGIPITMKCIERIREAPYPKLRKTESQLISVDVPDAITAPTDNSDATTVPTDNNDATTAPTDNNDIQPTNDLTFHNNPGNQTDEDMPDDFGDHVDPIDNVADVDNKTVADTPDTSVKAKGVGGKRKERKRRERTNKIVITHSMKAVKDHYTDILEKAMMSNKGSSDHPYRWTDDDLLNDSTKEENTDDALLNDSTKEENNMETKVEAVNETSDAHISDDDITMFLTNNVTKILDFKRIKGELISNSDMSDMQEWIEMQEDKDLAIMLLQRSIDENARMETETKCNVKIVRLSLQDQIIQMNAKRDSTHYKNSRYTCDFCYMGYKAVSEYKNHMAKHQVSHGQYVCIVCSLRYKEKNSFENHLLCHMLDYICNQCGKITKSRDSALHHYKWHKKLTYNCRICGISFDKSTAMLAHLQYSHASSATCSICNRRFETEEGLRGHVAKIHKDAVGAVCSSCSVQFHSQSALRRHRPQGDSCDPTHRPCAACGEGFPTNELLNDHTLKNHQPPSYTCELVYCGEQFASKAELDDHVNNHCLKRPYRKTATDTFICETCGLPTKTRSGLMLHMKTHAGKLNCDQCNLSFTNKHKLRCHMVMHEPKLPRFPCPHCDQRFSAFSKRLRHEIQEHGTGEPFPCEACGKHYYSRDHLRRHIQIKHCEVVWNQQPILPFCGD